MNASLIWKKCLAGVLLMTLSACSYSTPPADQAENWRVEYWISGGIAGMMQGLDLSGDGRVTVFDKRRGIRQEFIVSQQQVDAIAAQISALTANSAPNHTGTGTRRRCADCITRRLTIRHKGVHLQYKEQVGIDSTPSYRVILEILSKMLKQGLAAGKSANQ